MTESQTAATGRYFTAHCVYIRARGRSGEEKENHEETGFQITLLWQKHGDVKEIRHDPRMTL